MTWVMMSLFLMCCMSCVLVSCFLISCFPDELYPHYFGDDEFVPDMLCELFP